jgi:hypothetical protein
VPTIADVEPVIDHEFGSRLEPHGFQKIGRRKWVRSQKLPIRELLVIGTLGCRYYPSWGFSSGLVPSFDGHNFRRQSTDKNAITDLIIDPIDITGHVPRQIFSFIGGCNARPPVEEISACAAHFVPLAIADFDRVHSVHDFCRFFLERSTLRYRRIQFHMYVQQKLAHGFVLILTGRRDEGKKMIGEFCEEWDMKRDNRILLEYIHCAESYQAKT